VISLYLQNIMMLSPNQAIRFTLSTAVTAALSFIAGMSDAVGFSQTGEFVSFMSGNTTRMAIAFSNSDFSRGKRLSMVLVIFVIGNALGAMIARLAGQYRRTVLLLYVFALLALAAGLPAISGLPDTLGLESLPGFILLAESDMTLPSLVLLILAMAGLNATVESVEGVGLNLTFVTGALAKFGRGLGDLILGKKSFGWVLQLVPWSGLVIGAIVGNLLDNKYGRDALWLPATMSFLLAAAFAFVPKGWQKQIV
jgi:uncharacterized membrane protein YoaK (UPF0700 family)